MQMRARESNMMHLIFSQRQVIIINIQSDPVSLSPSMSYMNSMGMVLFTYFVIWHRALISNSYFLDYFVFHYANNLFSFTCT